MNNSQSYLNTMMTLNYQPSSSPLNNTPQSTRNYFTNNNNKKNSSNNNKNNDIITKSLDIHLKSRKSRESLKWGTINIAILSILLFDISNKCPFVFSKWYYLEYIVAGFFGLCVLYHFAKYFYLIFQFDPIKGTAEQKRLLQFGETDTSFLVNNNNNNINDTVNSNKTGTLNHQQQINHIFASSSLTPPVTFSKPNIHTSLSNLSWHSSFNDSNRTMSSPGWLYNRNSSPTPSTQTTPGGGTNNNKTYHSNASWNSFQSSNLSGGSGGGGGSGSMIPSINSTPFQSPYKNVNKNDIITDEYELQKYLREMANQQEKQMNNIVDARSGGSYGGGGGNGGDSSQQFDRSNSFWNYCNNAAILLKSSLYQLAPTTIIPTNKLNNAVIRDGDIVGGGSNSNNHIDGTIISHHINGTNTTSNIGINNNNNSNLATATIDQQYHPHLQNQQQHHHQQPHNDDPTEIVNKLLMSGDGVYTGGGQQLTQYIYNLRKWISVTILSRINDEINKINHALANNTNADCRGFSDIQIGKVGLDRLRKTAEIQQLVLYYVPTLPMIVPFLEISNNQEYLVNRIRDLAKGCVMAEYRWNGGGSYNGINWDEHLPTDSAIIFHLFCTYLDSQLPPLPNQPSGRSFFNRYIIMGDKKTPDEIKSEVKNKTQCAILCTNPMKPKFNFITQKIIHNCAQDRNNLFYVIVEFLLYMNAHNEGMLECVNLGRSGINLLKVIGD